MKEENIMKKKLHPVFAIYGFALVWVIFAAFTPILYYIAGVAQAVVCSLTVYFIIKIFFCRKDEKKIKLKFERTGVAEADAVIKHGMAFIKDIEKLNITNDKINAQTDKLKKTSADIFTFVKNNPESARQLATFTEYYFPTTVKLLTSYAEMQNKSSVGVNINETMKKIEDIMETICAAFDKQLDVLFEHKNLDIKTDISVLKSILERENLN